MPVKVTDILSDPCASYWLKEAIRQCLRRDAVDALNDADYTRGVAVVHFRR